MQFPCFNKKCHHNEKSDSGCKDKSRFFVDLCESFKPDTKEKGPQMILTKQQMKELEEKSEDLIKWLNDNFHPHTKIIIKPTSASLEENVCKVVNFRHTKD